MRFKEAVQELKRTVPVTRGLTKSKGRNMYNCIFCGSGTGAHGTGAMQYNPGTNTLYCHSCKNGEIGGAPADPINVQMKLYGQEFKEAVYQLARECHITIDNSKEENVKMAALPTTKNTQKIAENTRIPKEPTPNQFKDYIEKCETCAKKAVDYLQERGISSELITRYHIGYDPDKITYDKDTGEKIKGAVIFPHNPDYSYYSCRSVTGKGFGKPKSDTYGEQVLFNAAALYGNKPCYVCEGVADALSIMTAGGAACALAGTGGKPLLKEIKKRKPTHPLILALDNDPPKADGRTPGQDQQKKLAGALDEMKVPFVEAQYNIDQYGSGDNKDANDLLRANAGQLAHDIAENEKKAIDATPSTRPDNTHDYIKNLMTGEIKKLKEDAGRKTGFPNLDKEAGSIYSGLYVIGGISSVGKTTFVAQMADQMAARGQHVLFFSLEQSRLEMVSKSIARQTAINDINGAVTSLQIRLGAEGTSITRGFDEYMHGVRDRISVVEGNFNCDVDYIRNYVKVYIEQNSVHPVIIVDYLQIIGARTDPDTKRKLTDPRQITDVNVTALKRMSRDLRVPVIVASSVNRGNYLTPIDFESFKESGGIEYSADVVLGLQLKAINGELFNKDGKIKEKREAIAAAKKANPREIELVCLKNRYGNSRFNCYFKYYTTFDYFRPCDENGNEYDDGKFKPIPDYYETPFDGQ